MRNIASSARCRPSVLHRPENNAWLRWMLAVRAVKIQEAFCACNFGSHCWKRLGCFCNSCACAFGIISIVTVVMEDEVRFLWWLLVSVSTKSVPLRCSLAVTGVDALHLHLHHRPTRARTSFKYHDRLQREEEGCGHVHPCCRSCLCERTIISQKTPVKSC